MLAVFARDASVVLGCTRAKRDQIGVGACMDCVLERSDTAVKVGPTLVETPDAANSGLSTDNSAADVGELGNTRGYRICLI